MANCIIVWASAKTGLIVFLWESFYFDVERPSYCHVICEKALVVYLLEVDKNCGLEII